jgi:DNA-binding Lrp family transcriptional regulator
MTEEELLQMSQKERDRLKVLHEAKKRQITQREAAEQMGVSQRWIRKLLARMRRQGDGAVIHKLRGRSSQFAFQGRSAASPKIAVSRKRNSGSLGLPEPFVAIINYDSIWREPFVA